MISQGIQQLRRQIPDSHEWINEILIVSIYHQPKAPRRDQAWDDQQAKKKQLNLTLVRRCKNDLGGVAHEELI